MPHQQSKAIFEIFSSLWKLFFPSILHLHWVLFWWSIHRAKLTWIFWISLQEEAAYKKLAIISNQEFGNNFEIKYMYMYLVTIKENDWNNKAISSS